MNPILRVVFLSTVVVAEVCRTTATAAPAELGRVRWERSLDAGLQRAASSDKPVFLLFQEVPGCATCVGFGKSVLSEPLYVEAIESEFVPVAIFNNRGGADAEALKRYGEPAWNNPVVRFVDGAGVDLIARRDRVWSPLGIGQRMIAALEAAQRPVPTYLRVAVDAAALRSSGIATFSMPCFWRGEACLGGIESVVATRAGWLGGREVVEVRFDARSTDYASLLRQVAATDCVDGVFAHGAVQEESAVAVFGRARVTQSPGYARDAAPRDQKYYLRRSSLRELDVGPTQGARLNAAIAARTSPERWLSPRQIEAIGVPDSRR